MNRHERRKANKGKKKISFRVTVETFTTPNLGKKDIILDVQSMRVWAERNIEPQRIPIDADHVKRLVDGGAVRKDIVINHTINHLPKPILICEHPEGLGDEIVDGNHTYVAAAIMWAKAIEEGMLPSSITPSVIGYGLTAKQWQPFVINAAKKNIIDITPPTGKR